MNTKKLRKIFYMLLVAAILLTAAVPAVMAEEATPTPAASPPETPSPTQDTSATEPPTATPAASPTATAGDFTKSGLKNTSILFSTEDFAENFSAPDSAPIFAIKILTLPDAPDATLTFNDADVTADMEIPADQIGSLMFSPAGEWVGTTTFTYAAKAENTDYSEAATITIIISESLPGPLVVEDFSFTTKKNTPYSGQLIGHSTDEISAPFTFQIVDAPTKGAVDVTDVHTGDFTYTPFTDQIGDDVFTYRIVYEPYESAVATVNITIEDTPDEQLFQYADLGVHWAAYSASKLVERDITVGEKIGNKYFYRPDKQLSRGDVILLITSAVGLENLPEPDPNFKFADDSHIPSWMRQPAYRAVAAGIINGVAIDGDIYLAAHAPLTRIELLVMLNNAINPDHNSDIELDYADLTSIPDWAIQPVKNMEGYGLLRGYEDNTLRPYNLVTKAEGGELVYQFTKYLDAYPQTRAKLAGMVGHIATPVSYDENKGYMTVQAIE